MSHGKNISGNGTNLNACAIGEKGNAIPISIITDVSATTGVAAQLCINGILRVRIMCTISVCDSKLSTNQPVWNKSWWAGELALNTYHNTAKVA